MGQSKSKIFQIYANSANLQDTLVLNVTGHILISLKEREDLNPISVNFTEEDLSSCESFLICSKKACQQKYMEETKDSWNIWLLKQGGSSLEVTAANWDAVKTALKQGVRYNATKESKFNLEELYKEIQLQRISLTTETVAVATNIMPQ